jgi:acylphosphatase
MLKMSTGDKQEIRLKAVEIKIKGFVQGVGFRFFTISLAGEYNVNGWVCNEPDGSVKIFAQGEHGLLNEFVKRVSVGPRFSKVTAVDVQEKKVDPDVNSFGIRYW